MSDLLDPSALLETLPKLLAAPSSEESVSSDVSWQLRTQQDAIAALSYAIMTRLDFRLVNIGEGHKVTHAEQTSALKRLPKGWNRVGPDSYTFGYRHDQSSLEFIVKVIKMASRTMIHATAVEDNKTATYEVQTNDFTSPSFWPYPPDPSTSHPEPLVNGFISSSRLRDFVLAYKQLIVQKLVPGLRKEGYSEVPVEAEGSGSGSRNTTDAQRQGEGDRRPFHPGEPVGPRAPNRPPYFDEPDDPSMPNIGARNPLIIGDRDLDPLGGSPLAMPPRFGGGSFGPPPLFGGGGRGDTGGGMFVGPDHPMFRDRFQPGGIGGPGAGRGNLPPGAVPPGARFDPIGPFGPGPRPPGAGRGRGGGGGGGGGEPDWDEMPPPRSNDYDSMFG